MEKRSKLAVILLMAIILGACAEKKEEYKEVPIIAPTITIDFQTPTGDIKPVNGINNGPKSQAAVNETEISWGLDALQIYKELEIPFVRTHDTEYPDGSNYFIDVHCIFPDPGRDPDDETAYHFRGTDACIQNIRESGARVFYRLGESIAVSAEEAVYQYPPGDNMKWARVCEHIIAHYNEGWNKGFNYDIQYWEIWNEPDTPRQWIGDPAKYVDLYRTAARYLKEKFPDIKIGGGAFASAEEGVVRAFLEALTADGDRAPLDFCSWHLYTDKASDFTYRAGLVRSLLDEYGYTETETYADEWNYVEDWEDLESTWEKIRSGDMAAFYAACLITLQNTDVDGAMYYDGAMTGQIASWCGLYTDQGEKLPGYYGFQAFAQLKNTGVQVEITSNRDTSPYGIYACAVSGESDAILLANTSSNIVRFQMNSNSEKNRSESFTVNRDYYSGSRSIDADFPARTVIEMRPWEMRLITLN